ncbi:myo-inositol-1-phosphate synthase [Catenulispora sp. GP43]|uniref:inositol-3-phosphate synthase n=1 Tax=Catenulispora sp. GP43 TaxID=3156263 RepID=UPI0035130127
MTSADEAPATGVWLVGARGSVAVTAIVGAAALRAGLAEPVGCVTAGPRFAAARLPDYADLVFGGHDISDVSILKQAAELADDGVIPAALPGAVADDLRAADAAIRPATPRAGDPRSARQRISGLIADLEEFRAARRLRRVVVINVASTEPPIPGHPDHPDHWRLADLEAALDRDDADLPASSEYAYAALRAGCPYVDFTPSTGARLPALDELARSVGVPYAGSDAKTGETLLVSALAPMLTSRALRVRSWSGTNLLGGGDGATLADTGAAASKTASKRRGLDRLLGAPVEGRTHIDNVPAQGGWKTAWDHIGFEGFLGVRMTMQFTWQGCDSALAAPLVLDLARLLARAHECGAAGAFTPASFFFKDPVPATEHDEPDYRLANQYEALLSWAPSVAVEPEPEAGS